MAFQNFYISTLQTDIGASDTSIQVRQAPTATNGYMVLEARNSQKHEIISYSNVAGTTLTGVVRGLGGTVATTHVASTTIEMSPVSLYFEDLYAAFDGFSGANGSGWNAMVQVPTTVGYNGQRSYTLTYNGVDITSLVSPGTRLRTTRATVAPTQSTSLNGTNQYWSKTGTINKMSFTDDFVVSAWVKLSSYQTNTIASRYNGTSGWIFQVTSAGQVYLQGNNAGAANYSQVISYQSLPLNKWVHVTAQLDMSAFTATTTTSYIMIDGVDVPVSVARGGTNPTALVQAGDINIGASNGAQFFAGKIAQAAVFNAKVTQPTMRGYISQGLTGTETSLASAYSFNGNANDLMTTTPNNLTAAGSAVATEADSPFGTQASGLISSTLDYGIVQSATYAGGNTTVVVQVPEGCTIPTSGGVSAMSYSAMKAPYGFPAGRDKWTLETLIGTNLSAAIAGLNAWYAYTAKLTVPQGYFNVGWQGTGQISTSVGGASDSWVSMGESTPPEGELSIRIQSGVATTYSNGSGARNKAKNFSAQTTLSMYQWVSAGSGTLTGILLGAGSTGQAPHFKMFAENAYL